MRPGRFAAWAAGVVVALAWTRSPARADTPPDVWDIAGDPVEAERWALHVRVGRLLHSPTSDDTALELHCEAAYAMLEQAGAEQSSDVRLRVDLGIVQYELGKLSGRSDLYEKAARTLSAAVDAAPDHPAALEALESLAYVYAKLDRPRDELRAWQRYIPKLIEPSSRAISLMNMGEAEMRMGLVDDALATFREVVRACGELPNDSSTYVLALWDVAVALDRSGDARGALEMAGRAAGQTAIGAAGPVTGSALIRDDKNVFFVPDWEKLWYLALGSEAQGRSAEPREALKYFIESEDQWDEYIASAKAAAAGGPRDLGAARTDNAAAKTTAAQWLRIAKLRHDRVHAERVALQARLPKSVSPPATAAGAED